MPEANFAQPFIAPIPFEFNMTKVTLPGPPETQALMLMFNSAVGVSHYFLPLEMASQMGKAIVEASTGIVLAGPSDLLVKR